MNDNQQNLMVNDWQQKAVTAVDKAIAGMLAVYVFALPLFFLPITIEWFDTNKILLATLGSIVFGLVFIVRFLMTKKYSLTRSPFDLPIAGFAVVAIISAYFSTNRNLELVAQAIPTVAATFLFFWFTNLLSKRDQLKTVANGLLVSGIILSLLSIISNLLFFLSKAPSASISSSIPALLAKLPFLSPTFSLTGTLFTQTFWILILIPLAFGLYKSSTQENDGTGEVNYLVLLVVLVLATGLNAFQLYLNRPLFLDPSTSWKIATGVLGTSFKDALFGVSGGNYVDAFTAFKTAAFNLNPSWNLRFGAASGHYLHFLATNGVVGLAMIVLLIYRFYQLFKASASRKINGFELGVFGSITITLIAFIFVPSPFLILVLLNILLALCAVSYKNSEYQIGSITSPAIPYLFSLITLIGLIGGIGYFTLRNYLGNFYMAKSFDAGAANNGTETYNYQIKALELDPDNDSYRISYAQTNLALADSLAGNLAKNPAETSEEQKNTVVQLIQQSIREGRNAVTLNPKRAGNWENLYGIYRNLINFASGADQWSLASLNQAIANDPNNPRLRTELGSLFLAANNLLSAGQAYGLAISLKEDYVPARYSLSQILYRLGEKDAAKEQLEFLKNLVCNSTIASPTQSSDCKKINDDLNFLANESAAKPPAATPSAESSLVASPSAKPANLPKVKPSPAPVISSPSGELTN